MVRLATPEEVFTPATRPDNRTLIADIKARRIAGLVFQNRPYLLVQDGRAPTGPLPILLALPREIFTEAALPDQRTLRADIKSGRIPGVIVERRLYIDVIELQRRIRESPAAVVPPKRGRYRH